MKQIPIHPSTIQQLTDYLKDNKGGYSVNDFTIMLQTNHVQIIEYLKFNHPSLHKDVWNPACNMEINQSFYIKVTKEVLRTLITNKVFISNEYV